MKLQKYLSNKFTNIEEVDYADLFMGDKFVGMFTVSFALKGKYLALDPMENENSASYCFPIDTLIEVDGGMIKFEYCGSNFELTLFLL